MVLVVGVGGGHIMSPLSIIHPIQPIQWLRERSGLVVECLTGDRGVVGLSLTGVTVLCP